MWKTDGAGFSAQFDGLVLRVGAKGDGRWTWSATREGADQPMASGLARSANEAKRTAENFAKRGP